MSIETEGRIFGNKYLVIDELGRGGMGAVYMVRDTKLQRHVALKHLILAPELDDAAKDELIYNFKREAIALANISHPNIVNVYDLGQEDENNHYIVMELIDGQPLSKFLKENSLLPEEFINISGQISDALDYVHRNGVIHRDIKPDNIIYTSKGVCKLTDFGIAKSANTQSDSLYSQGSIVGTILYISPEQLQNPEEVDGRADQYSFAVTLYELITGHPPFQSDNPREVIMKILGEEPIPPSQLSPNVSEKLDAVLLKAMAKNREDRYLDTTGFAIDLAVAFEEFNAEKIKNDSLNEKRKADDDMMKNVNLDWLDKLDQLMEEDNEPVTRNYFFQRSLDYIIPRIPAEDIKSLVLILSTKPDHIELINFLSNFDGEKTLRDVIQKNLNGGIFDKIIECAESNLIDPKAIEMVKNLNQVISCSDHLMAFVAILKNNTYAPDLIKFLNIFDGKTTMKQIIDKYYSIEQLNFLFDFLYQCNRQEITEIDILDYPPDEQIFFGDMLVSFSLITRPQLNLVLKECKAPDIMIGENLISMGFLTKERMMNTLKVQLWYKKFFPVK